nr:XdhC family protein [Streptomyces noursei]
MGLTCGGIIDIFIAPVRASIPGAADGGPAGNPVDSNAATLAAALTAASSGEAAAVARIIKGPDDLLGRALLVRPDGSHTGTLGGHPALDRTAVEETPPCWTPGGPRRWRSGPAPRPRRKRGAKAERSAAVRGAASRCSCSSSPRCPPRA